ncbi:hypothetical protein [Bacteroides sp.]|uniref:hypothetical protein n=1 Tax=Bacteroides sp. TaxID=29523 RepID=UPI00260A7950|nr:hypothetical protein [Bacteroides sp.]MDD3037926.1 hypothetical protein [Bacteroides sp.]
MSEYGTVTLGFGTDEQREVEIVDYIRSEFKDHRLITVAKTEEDAYLLCVENPESSGRNTCSKMYLSLGSLVALLASTHLFFQNQGLDMAELLKEYVEGDVINYEYPNDNNQQNSEE